MFTPTHLHIQAWKFKYFINEDTEPMVQKVMTNLNLEWRDRGNDTSKTFMDRVARFSIAKVRKSLMPMLLRKTVQEYTTQGVRKRRRGGARRQKFNPEHNIKKENAVDGYMTGNNTGNVPPTVAAFSKRQNTDSPMSTIGLGASGKTCKHL